MNQNFVISGAEPPSYPELDALAPNDARRVMFIAPGNDDDPRVQVAKLLRNLLVELVLYKGSDVHLTASQGQIVISSELGSSQVNRTVWADDEIIQKFREKLFALTNTPQGGMTPDLGSTRFSMELPARFVNDRGLGVEDPDRKWYLINVRVQYAKTFNGWAFILRQLDQQRAPALQDIHMSGVLRTALMRALNSADGLILVTGPTGSGKTTLLNAMLSYLNDGTLIIGTIENPVEYELAPKSAHVQLEVGGIINFASGLRALLRAHPRVILVGEIRDSETMETAIQAAQSGHLVLATVHTIDTVKTITRAVDLAKNVDSPAMRIAQVLRFIVAVRLLRVYETDDCIERRITEEERLWLTANGIVHSKDTIKEAADHAKLRSEPVVPVLEGLAVDLGMEEAICSLDETRIFELATQQPQFETLAQAGFRTLLERGAKFDGCHKLGTALRAQDFKTRVAQIAMRLSMTHVEAMNFLDKELTDASA